jgi:hypothetical protein
MADDLEGDVQQSPADSTPPSAPASEPGEIVSSDDIRRAVETQRERGPDGRFARGEQRGAAAGVATAAAADKPAARGVGRDREAGAGASEPAKADSSAGHRPPPGFSVAAKQAWDALPEPVKADIVRREAEIEAGTKRYSGLANFAEEAERNGTTLQNAVADYSAVETELRRDPVAGVEFMFRKMGLNPLAVLNAWVKRYMAAQQDGGPQPPPPAQYAAVDPNAIVAQATQAVRSEFQMREIHNDIAQFAANPANWFFANVRMDMSNLVQVGKAANLQEAYEAACWLNPEIRAILLAEMQGGQDKAAVRAAARAQNAAKAVTGAPSNSHAGEPPKRRDLSIDETIRAAIAAQRGNA